MKMLLALSLILIAAPAHAIHETVFAINAADAANNRLLANPPLPMLRYSPGKWKLALSPYYFSGEQDFVEGSPSGSFRTTGKFKGGGMGLSGSWAFAERWGLFVFGVGNTVTGKDMAYVPAGNPNAAAQSSQLLDAKASAITLSGGVVHQFFGREESGFVLPVFAGLLLKKYDFSHRVIESSLGAVVSDFDVESSGIAPGVLVGAEAGIDLGKKWQLNPFVIMGMVASSELDVKVKQVRVNAQPNNRQQSVNRLLGGEKLESENAFGGIGLNLTYRPWGITANLTSPFLPSLIESDSKLDAAVFSVSWAFGPGK